MQLKTFFRICVIMEWIFFILYIILSFILENHLPDQLRDWLILEAERNITLNDIFLILFAGVILLMMLISSIGLLFLKKWAAWLYLITLVFAALFTPFAGPMVDHALASTVGETTTFISGLIIGLAFFTDVLEKKKGEIAQTTISPSI